MSYCTLDPNISDNKLNLGADLEISVCAKFIQFYQFLFLLNICINYKKILDAATALEAELEAPELGFFSCTIVVILFIKFDNNF